MLTLPMMIVLVALPIGSAHDMFFVLYSDTNHTEGGSPLSRTGAYIKI